MPKKYIVLILALLCLSSACTDTTETENEVVGAYSSVQLYESGNLTYEDIPLEISKTADGLLLDMDLPALQGSQLLTNKGDTLSFYDLHFEYPCDDYVKGSLHWRNDSLLISITDQVCGGGQSPSHTVRLEGYAIK